MSDARPDATPEPPPRPPVWRRPVVLVASALALVLVVVGAVLLSQRNAAEAREQSVRDTATRYLKAIADADANAALALLARPPAGRELLTNDVLKASATAAPLTDVVVTGSQITAESATVGVSYRLGSEPVTTDLALEGDGKTSWKVVDGLSELMVTNTAGLRVNGAQITQPVHPVFPGTYTATPLVEQLALDGAPTVTIPAPATAQATLQVTPKLSEAGLAQSRAAAKAAFDACLATTVSAPPGCPWRMDETNVQVTPGSVRYALKNDPWSAFTPTLDVATLTAKGVAQPAFDAAAHVTAPDRSGDVVVTLTLDTPVTIDLASNPLKVTWV